MSAFFNRVIEQQNTKKTLLCVGLDPHLDKLPEKMRGQRDQVLPFLKEVVDATAPYACSFKPQIAYFAAYGLESSLFEIITYIHQNHPEVPVILDAKRNDIGTTADMYALEAFERYGADAVTVSPYMGGDTIEPFTKYKDKGVFALCRTSNAGASELQNQNLSGERLFSYVADRAMNHWNQNKNLGLVMGATAIEELSEMRKRHPEAWFLVPGVGAQGGDMQAVMKEGWGDQASGLIINSARGIIYAGSGDDFATKAGDKAKEMQTAMSQAFS